MPSFMDGRYRTARLHRTCTMVSTIFLVAVLALLLIYLLAVALGTGIVLGRLICSPILAFIAGGPAAVSVLYSSSFALVLMFNPRQGVLLEADWAFLAAWLMYPAAPIFVVGAVTAGATSAIRAIRASR